MKLKNISRIAALSLAFATMTAVTSCKDDISDDLRAEARIEPYSFTVTGTGKTNPDKGAPVFRTTFSDDGHTIYIRLPENYDPAVELKGATVQFFLSMGASVTPIMAEPQDFSNPDNPVVYTVTSADGTRTEKYTVTFMVIPPTKVEKGTGFTGSELAAYKTYVELGFPGKYGSWSIWDSSELNVTMGDLLGMPAFCGDKLVIFSRSYAWGNAEEIYGVPAFAPDHSQAFKVFSLPDLTPAEGLNLGGISPSEIVAISSDSAGHMVAAVGRKAGGKTDFYYWTSTTDAPELLGSAEVSCEIGNHDADAGSYINVTGNVTTAAVIAASAPRDNDGSHYKFKVAGSRLVPGYEIIKTGHSSNDKSWFQMISYFGTGDNDPYLVGDCQDNPGNENGHVQVYLNNANGTNRGTMDYHNTSINGWVHDDGEAWWSRSGKWILRGGGRRPTVHAMTINGVPYSFFTTGSDWRVRGVLMNQELSECITLPSGEKDPYPHFGFGLTTKAKHPNGKDGGIWIGQSYGAMADWMFDEENMEGWVAVWSDRFGIHLFKLTCLEV